MMPLIPKRGDISEYFREATGLSGGELEAFFDNLPPAERAEIRALLEADRDSDNFLESAIGEELSSFGEGERFGSFETVSLLGRGGMGAVFLARRVDGDVEQTAAVKIIERGWLDPRAVERFRQERTFLARLSHPNIARLLDSGTRADGIAFLIMEYVDGLRIDKYCDQHGLNVEERLRLFLPLCDAVDYAHRKLIVHRDLKPSNVIVSQDGRPKLLDFGVAKALQPLPFDAEQGDSPPTLILTPDFASPEQVRGEDITTATDVYGLASLLYFLLTGRAPHQTAGASRAALERAICDADPERPSVHRPELKGDLENTLMKGLHREPTRRYPSARAFADDLENYLRRRPVQATPDSAWYRLRRFMQRNKAASIAAALAMIAVAGGAAASVHQARRAQYRFGQVRELANKFIFEFEASVRDTPGTLEARRKMAATARQYLTNLDADAGSDPALQREVAQSHYRLSEVEAQAQEYDAWIADLKKSAEVLRGLHDDCCGTLDQRALYVNVLDDMVHYWVDHTPKEALAPAEEGLRNAKELQTKWPGDPLAARTLIDATMMQGAALSNVLRIRESLNYMKEAVRLCDEAIRKFPDDPELIAQRATTGNRLIAVSSLNGDYDQALAAAQKTAEIIDPLIAAHPENIRWRADRIRLASNLAGALRNASSQRPELKPQLNGAFRDAYLMAREHAARNPANDNALDLRFVMTAKYANQLKRDGNSAEALALQKEAESVLDILSRVNSADRPNMMLRANNMSTQAGLLVDMRSWTEAQAELDRAKTLLDSIAAKWPDDVEAMDLQVWTLVYRTEMAQALQKREQAAEFCQQAIRIGARILDLSKEDTGAVGAVRELRQQARALGVSDSALSRLK
jgi:tetratricopeptide (TPR) repeat protein